jgi:hypothetical protein
MKSLFSTASFTWAMQDSDRARIKTFSAKPPRRALDLKRSARSLIRTVQTTLIDQ